MYDFVSAFSVKLLKSTTASLIIPKKKNKV